MKIKLSSIFSLILASTGVLVFAAAEPAMAQNARFAYAPNVYRVDEGGKPRRAQYQAAPQAVHNVTHGAVPKGSNFLGLDSGFLAKPHPTTTVAAHPLGIGRPSTMAAMRSVKATPYNGGFGRPQTPLVAQATRLPAAPQVRTAQQARGRVVHHKPAAGARAHAVRGKSNVARQAKPAIANYGNSRHYQSGSFTQDMHSTSTRVSGKVLGH